MAKNRSRTEKNDGGLNFIEEWADSCDQCVDSPFFESYKKIVAGRPGTDRRRQSNLPRRRRPWPVMEIIPAILFAGSVGA
jgi:hypothetical protein